MRFVLGVFLICCIPPASAEAFKCVSPAGEVIFSDTPCDDGEKFIKIRPSESANDPAAAQLELQRQKAVADRVAAENAAARQSSGGAFALPDNSSPPPDSPPGLSFPGGSSSGSGSGSNLGVPKGVPAPSSRK